MLFQHVLFISLNLHHSKVHVQHEYIIINVKLTIYHHFLQGTMFLTIKKLMSRYTVHEDRPV